MKKILVKWFGDVWYCRMFHSAMGTKDNKWHCKSCGLTYDRRLSDDYWTGPR